MRPTSLTKLVLVCTFFISGILHGIAQSESDNTSITASYENQSLSNILKDIERQTGRTFHVDGGEYLNTVMNRNFNAASLEEVLEDLFQGLTHGYLIYRDYAVMILPRSLLDQEFSSEYYQVLNQQSGSASTSANKNQVIGNIQSLRPNGQATITGIISDESDGETIIGATVYIESLEKGSSTDAEGKFELTVPAGTYDLTVQYIGYDDVQKTIEVYSDGTLDIKMYKSAINLKEIVVYSEAVDANVDDVQIGIESVDLESIDKAPAFMGEADVVKTLLLNPGVSSVGEASSGFNVRGGEVDQNLIIQDEAMLFNTSHALGILSSFNTDLLRSVELYKGSVPAQFGGRLVSVMDVKFKDGDFQKFKAKAGISPVTSKIVLEGPIATDKTSFIVGARSSYTDWLLDLTTVPELQNSTNFFYDASARLTHKFNKDNTLTFSGYTSLDKFEYNQEFGFEYETILGQMSFRSIFNDKAYNNFSVHYSKYNSIQTDFGDDDSSELENNISYIKVKEQFTINPSNGLKIDLGASGILYTVDPGERRPLEAESNILPQTLPQEKALEAAAFVNIDKEIDARLLISGGVRFNYYSFLGPGTLNEYENPERPTLGTVTGTTTFGDGENIFDNLSIEPRFAIRYKLNEVSSLKAGYSRTSQSINQIFNTDTPTPTSQWKLSNQYVPVNKAHSVSVGYFRNIQNNTWETSAEIFGRQIDQLFDYRDFARLNLNPNLETELLRGEGRAYGLELSVKKKIGVVNGSFSYTFSRTEKLIDGINNGTWYPSNFDKPHDVSLVVNINPSKRQTLSFNFIYATGRPTTPPFGSFTNSSGQFIQVYSNRNALRIPDYHRLDVSYTIGKGYKKDKTFQTSWSLSVYNLYARRNAYSVFFTQGFAQRAQGNQLSVLGSIFPSLSFNVEIQ